MTPPDPSRLLRVRVEKLVAGGAGLARDSEGRVVLVAGAAPGDLVAAEVTATHKGVRRARVVQVLEPGPGRRSPPCPLAAERCGGCTLQHLSYEAQIDAKLAILRESLTRTGRITAPDEIRVHRSPEWGYRRRARLHIDGRPGQPLRLGFRDKDGREVVTIGPCPVLTPALEQALPELRARLAAESRRTGDVSLLDVPGGVRLAGAAGEATEGTVEVAGERLRVSANFFFQANAPLLETLVKRVVELAAAEPRPALAFDLYAGVGLFTLALGRRFEEVVAIEEMTGAAALLTVNAGAAGLDRIQVHAAAVETVLAGPPGARLGGSVVVADPPREGLAASVRRALLEAPPERLIYVACDPVALARDLGELTRGGFTLAGLELFDLFPQTHHLETVATLVRGCGSVPAQLSDKMWTI